MYRQTRHSLKQVTDRLGLLAVNAMARTQPGQLQTRSYGSHARQQLDWYRLPDGGNGITVLFFYGGSWRSGRRRDYRFVADTLLSLGCQVVLPDYRLYPEVRFSEILVDVARSADETIRLLGQDQRLVVMGHSAGAQLAALLTLNPDLSAVSERAAAMIGLAGPYDFYPFTDEDHWTLFGPEERYPQSQPVNFVSAAAPSLYLLHGADDRRVRPAHSRSLAERQQAAGGSAEYRVYPGLGHVDILLEMIRPRRGGSPVVAELARLIRQIEAAPAGAGQESQSTG